MSNALMTELASLAGSAGDLAAGVSTGGGFAVLSTANRTFTIRRGDQQTRLVDERGRPRLDVDVVILAAAPRLSKTYYESAYGPTTTSTAPTCFSLDGVRPDPSVAQPQHAECATCPKNAWGSDRPGSSAKACTDRKRLAVVLREGLYDLIDGKSVPEPLLLSVPPKSFAGLVHVQRRFNDVRLPVWAGCTQINFDHTAAYPVLAFRLVEPLSAQEIAAVLAVMHGFKPTIQNIIGVPEWEPPPVPGSTMDEFSRLNTTVTALLASAEQAEAVDEPRPLPSPASRRVDAPTAQVRRASAAAPKPEPSRARRTVTILDAAAAEADAKVAWLMDDEEN